ncbi:Thermonuclease precursor [Escherichia coli]|nr:Thermonuclease precursor [Escherichia coli]
MIKYIFSLTIIFSASLCAAQIQGHVIRVLDGDTLEILQDKKPVRVRLANIDAPEKKTALWTLVSHSAEGPGGRKARKPCNTRRQTGMAVFSAGSIPLTAQKQIAGRSVTALPGCTRTTIMTILSRRSSVMPAP